MPYYVDAGPPETDVLIGPAQRTPENPAIGEYYASVQIPSSATYGKYRIRWTLRELVNSPQQTVVQNFAILENASTGFTSQTLRSRWWISSASSLETRTLTDIITSDPRA